MTLDIITEEETVAYLSYHFGIYEENETSNRASKVKREMN
jgi:hypothetical protein